MFRTICAAAFLFLALRPLLAQEEPGEDTSAGLPKEYADYLIASSTLSPDKKFAVIYPKTELCVDQPKEGSKNRCQDYLVALRPFQILATLETENPEFQNKNHGGISASWSEGGAAVLVTLDAKWGPEAVFLCEIADGKLTRSTSLLPKVRDLFLPDYKDAKIGPTDEFAFLIENPMEDEFAQFTDSGQVRIRAMATTDPKETPGRKAWEATVEAIWDMPQGRFTSQEVNRTFAGVRPAVDD